MKTTRPRKIAPGGFVSYVLVLTAGLTLTLLTVSAYKWAIHSQKVQGETQIRVDYADKEDEILRAIVNITPNRAIRAMKGQSSSSTVRSNPLRWQAIFSDAIDQANARTSISATLTNNLNANGVITGNAGDSALGDLNSLVDAIEPEPGYMSHGMNRSLGAGFPPPLEGPSEVAALDRIYPIISSSKVYGNLAAAHTPEAGGPTLPVATYASVNKIRYPDIRFGYSAPGQPFVAKRNWWAFSLQLGENDQLLRSFSRGDGSVGERDFILSIYEIPSQLAISAEAFASVGAHADGTAWANANIEGGIYTTRGEIKSGFHLDRLSGRRKLTLSEGASVGENAVTGDAFAPGARELYEVNNNDAFVPVSLASEAGRAAFIPINRRDEFFDRFGAEAADESNTLSPTTWNDYSIGARQCAMRLDVIRAVSALDPTPSRLRFSYKRGSARVNYEFDTSPTVTSTYLANNFYAWAANEGGTVDYGTQVVDLAYGAGSSFAVLKGVSGEIKFNTDTFGDPGVPDPKGYVRPACPFEVKMLHGVKRSICVYPKRIPAFLQAIGGATAGPDINSSLVVNVDYTIGEPGLTRPMPSPCPESDYGVLIEQCEDLTAFTKGFSLVTNMRLYIGDDFNTTATTPPAGTGLPAPFYPPASLFAPEKRYGTSEDPKRVELNGQMGHMGGDEGEGGAKVHLLDLKMASETMAASSKIDVNLRPITHPAELPPITMMNWLIVIEERRKAFYNANGTAR